jgi:hypothetical protein
MKNLPIVHLTTWHVDPVKIDAVAAVAEASLSVGFVVFLFG